MDQELLFIYGTLIPGQGPEELAAMTRRLALVGPATMRGRLFDLGEYPGFVADSDGPIVRGRLVRVPVELWKWLDHYEGCDEGLFRRVRGKAIASDGAVHSCWVYVYNRPVSNVRLVPGGCWLTHRSQRNISHT